MSIDKQVIGKQTRSFELRAADGDKFEINARAIKYGAISKAIGSAFYERIAAGAFSKSLKNPDPNWSGDIICTINHDPNRGLLGREKNGSLSITDNAEGLFFRCALNKNVSLHRDVFENVKSGLISECSFTFTSGQGDYTWDKDNYKDGLPLRTVHHGEIDEVAVVWNPAYGNGATTAQARAALTDVLLGGVQTLRKAAQIYARDLARKLRNDPNGMDQTDFASQMRCAHEMAEMCHSQMCQADDVMSADDDCTDDDTRAAFRKAHAASLASCEQLAQARLLHGRAQDAKKAKK